MEKIGVLIKSNVKNVKKEENSRLIILNPWDLILESPTIFQIIYFACFILVVKHYVSPVTRKKQMLNEKGEKMKSNKVLCLDIETSVMLAYIFRLGKQVIRSDQIAEDWRLLCYTAKWLGANKVIYEEAKKESKEKEILDKLWKLLNEAEIVITQNGTIFDAKRINARMIYYEMTPPSPYRHYDLYRLVKIVADFTSKSLAYLTSKLCQRHVKLLHQKFAGMKLWIECRAGNKNAWKEMKQYNREDVLSMEELYLKLRAWAPESFPKVYNMTDESYECGTCGYEGAMREGQPRKTKKYKYKQHACPKCGSWQRGVKI